MTTNSQWAKEPQDTSGAGSGDTTRSLWSPKPYVMPDDPEEGSVEALTQGSCRRGQGQACCARWPRWKICASAPQKEVADARTYGITAFARDVLDIADNLQRAGRGADGSARSRRSRPQGADRRRRTDRAVAAQDAGEKRRQKLDPLGEKFDPNLHQAMYEVPDSVGAGRHRRAGRAGRLHHRRARAAPGAGRRWPRAARRAKAFSRSDGRRPHPNRRCNEA